MPTKTLRNERVRRRRNLMRSIGRGAIAIVPSSPVRNRNRSVDYIFRQDSDFYYLTGFTEPEAVAVLIPGRPQGEYLLAPIPTPVLVAQVATVAGEAVYSLPLANDTSMLGLQAFLHASSLHPPSVSRSARAGRTGPVTRRAGTSFRFPAIPTRRRAGPARGRAARGVRRP